MGYSSESQKSSCSLHSYHLQPGSQACLYVLISEIYSKDPLCQGQCFMLLRVIDGRPWATYGDYIALFAKFILMFYCWVLTKEAAKTTALGILMHIL